jgi:putative ATP-dependent endonuclease of OLD family
VGLLLVVGAMLDVRGEETLPEHARPIIAIEEPEAHLHPIVLASTWDVIESLSAQTVVTTNSGELLGSVPMKSLRRLVRGDRQIDARRLEDRTLSETDLRRVSYHIRAKRGGVLFSRCWLLVEGESEFWLLNQLAHVLGYDLEAEGVRCVEFAQCGVTPLVKLANDLGIEWHMLADGDESGAAYVREASKHLGAQPLPRRVSQLAHRDVERCLWHHGFEHVFTDAARSADRADGRGRRLPPGRVIAKAVRKRSKPYLALMVAEECAARGPDSVPPVLRNVVEASVSLAREAIADGPRRSRK